MTRMFREADPKRFLHPVLAAIAAVGVGAFVARAGAPAGRYVIRDARIVTMTGATIDKGTVVMSDGLIEDVGASVAVPADAVVIDGAGLTVYPGFIDMANASAVEVPAPAQGRGRADRRRSSKTSNARGGSIC
jgi:hypothetical protein